MKTHRLLFAVKLIAALAIVACSKSPQPAVAARDWPTAYAALLAKYVSADGVDYDKWKAARDDLATLESVTQGIAAEKLSGRTRDEKLAFYLNAYNAWILKRILDAYPVNGPGDGSAVKRAWFFKKKSIVVAGKKMSFSALENDIIRPAFDDPRIHFALNCASTSCPPLHGAPFEAKSLDATLTALTRAFINDNPLGFQLSPDGETARFSMIFKWYQEDFEGGALAYANKFRASPVDTGLKVEFMEYDWSLNEVR